MTKNDDKGLESDFTFVVNVPVEVCIAYDLRPEVLPEWLNQFTDTGKVIDTSDVAFGLFCKSVQAGSVVLGPNTGPSMYFVIYGDGTVIER